MSCYDDVFGWVAALGEKDCVVCAETSFFEKEVLKDLLVRRIPVVLVVTKAFAIEDHWAATEALHEGRMLIVQLGRESGVSTETVTLRNRTMMDMAEEVVLGYVRPGGHMAKLLNDPKVHLAKDLLPPVAAEPLAMNTGRWTKMEDKQLMVMFSKDKGLRYIHERLRRPYSSVNERLKMLVPDETVMTGWEFESFVLRLLQLKSRRDLVLREWRSDKSVDGLVAEANSYPDMVLVQYEGTRQMEFAIECKWRKHFAGIHGEITWADNDNMTRYRMFEESRDIPVFVVIGVGGDPSAPEILYIVPLDKIASTKLRRGWLEKYRRPLMMDMLRYYPETRTLTSANKALEPLMKSGSGSNPMGGMEMRQDKNSLRWTPAQDQELELMCNAGASMDDMVRHFNRKMEAIRSRMKRLGLSRPSDKHLTTPSHTDSI